MDKDKDIQNDDGLNKEEVNPSSPSDAEKIKSLEQSFSIIADTYEKLHRKRLNSLYKPRPTRWKKVWHLITHAHSNSRHWGAYLLVIMALVGYFWNFRLDHENIKYAQIEETINKKLEWEQTLTKNATAARVLVENQIILCSETTLSQNQMKTQRNDALINLAAQSYGLTSVFSPAVKQKTIEFITEIDNISDVCKIDYKAFDIAMRIKYREIIKLMDESIKKDKQEMARYGSKRHIEIPLEGEIHHH